MVIITVPTIPPSPNVLRRKYRTPHAYRRLRRQFEHDLWYGNSGSGRQREELKHQAQFGKMFVQMIIHHSAKYDPDNLQGAYKPVLDALVNIGFIGGDTDKHIRLLPAEQIKCKRAEQKLVVKIGAVD